jgi:hypothetical protein
VASRFDTYFQTSGFVGLLAEFGEPVVYYFAGGGSRSIVAIIERNPPAIFDQAGNPMQIEMIIRVRRHASRGILSSEVSRGQDGVELLRRVDDAVATRYTVVRKLSDDSGVVSLALSGSGGA